MIAVLSTGAFTALLVVAWVACMVAAALWLRGRMR